MPSRRLLRIDGVKTKVGYKSNSTIYAKMANGHFPQSIKINDGSGSVRWIESEVDDWIERQIAACRGEAPA